MKFLAHAAMGVAVLAAAGSVQAEQVTTLCGSREAIHASLAQKYDETPMIRALSGTGNLIELLASPKGSWTMVVTRPGGPSCIVSTGEMWQPLQGASLVSPEA